MSSEVGRTGFHVVHTKAVSERGAILDEMMRELSEESIARWAKRNPSIVVEDEHLDIALVNGGDGEMVPCTDPKQVIEYGEQRLARLSSPVREGKVDPATNKVKGGTTTTSMFVLHLPKSLCIEVPDFYPVLDDDGNEVGRRSRWVAHDRDEALEYFEDAMEFMASQVIPGGWDAVLGADIQFSESTPHIQVLADTFAPDPRPGHEGELRCDYSRAYGSHRDVRDAKGRQMSGQAKFRKYHADLKDWMIEHGWPVEREVDPLRHDKTETKATYGKLKDEQRALDEQRDQLKADRLDLIRDGENLEREEMQVSLARKQVEKDRATAREEGRREGYEQGTAEAERARQIAREQALKAQEAAREAASHLASVRSSRPLSGELARTFFMDGVQVLANTLVEKINDPAVKALIEARRQAYLIFAESSGFAEYAKSIRATKATTRERALDRNEQRQRTVNRRVREVSESINTPQPEHDDGYEF